MPIDWGREAMDSERPVPSSGGPLGGASIVCGKLARGVTTAGPPEAAVALEGIGVSLARLEKELSELEKRLAPVLLPAPPTTGAATNGGQVGSPLTQMLREVQRKIDALYTWSEAVRGRLEV